jgi:hypothetical protein
MLYQGKLVQEYKSPVFISLPCFRFGLITLQEVLEKLLAASVCQPQAPESLCSKLFDVVICYNSRCGKERLLQLCFYPINVPAMCHVEVRAYLFRPWIALWPCTSTNIFPFSITQYIES